MAKRTVYKVENKIGEWIIMEDGKKVGDIHAGRSDYRIFFYNGFVYYRTDIDHAKEVARHGEAGNNQPVLPRQQALDFSKKKAVKAAKPKAERARKLNAELSAKINAAASMEVKVQKVNENTYDVSRTVNADIANRWAERIQKIRGITVVGTKDEVDGDKMIQTVRFILRSPEDTDMSFADPRPKVVLRRASESNWYDGCDWTIN